MKKVKGNMKNHRDHLNCGNNESERLERNSIGIEISKDYCELAYNRLKKE